MAPHFLKNLQSSMTPDIKISKKFWIFFTLALILWTTLVSVRPHVIYPRCKYDPSLCDKNKIHGLEKVAVHKIDFKWGFYSDVSQYASGALAILGPAALHASFTLSKSIHPSIAIAAYFRDFLIAFHAVAWSGVATEAAKVSFQRVRPFAYVHPPHQKHMHAFSSYTSFYSGHTSFAAAAGTAHFLTLLARGAGAGWLFSSFFLYFFLTVFTALARVMSGVHFPSDVLVGAIMGTLISASVILKIRQNTKPFSKSITLPDDQRITPKSLKNKSAQTRKNLGVSNDLFHSD